MAILSIEIKSIAQRCNIATAIHGIRLMMNCNVMKTHISNII